MSEKFDLGTATENEIQRFVEHSFGVDFVYRSPSHMKGGKEKETTDILSLFRDVAVPIQVKSQAYNADGSRKADRRWTRKNLKKAVAQVAGAVRTLRSHETVTLQNIRRATLVFEKAKAEYFYGVVILNHVDAPFLPEELVPHITELDFPIHVFSLADFYNVVRILDTPGDLTGYLEMRTDVLIPILKPRVHEEEVTLDYFLKNLEELMVFRAELKGDRLSTEIVRPYADSLRQIASGTFSDLRASHYIDMIIDKVHEVDESLPIPAGAARSDYTIIAEELSRLVRPRRGYLGRQFLDAIERAEQNNENAYAHASSQRRKECILFLASPRPQEERVKRVEELQQHLELLRTTRGVDRGFGIATEAGHSSGRSYDFILSEGDPDAGWPRESLPKIKELGEMMFGTAEPL